MSESVDVKKIEAEFSMQIEELRASIERVGLRQDELKSYIFDVTNAMNEIRTQISNLPKEAYDARSKFHIAMQKNAELISRFYETISSFEVVRQRYQQDIGKLTRDKVYLLNIEIRKVENKIEGSSSTLVTFMKELRSLVSSATENPQVSQKILSSLEKNPEYSME